MILEKQTESQILQEGTSQESVKMSLDLDSAQVLMQMLSKNLYSDSIGSTIRECASNALDSHRRAGVTDPIIVSLKATKAGTFEFAVEDFGIGLDAEDVTNIISKYGKSTKRDSNIELGMMGLGFKAPLAYSSSFYFIARKHGVERKYMMYEGEDVNTIDLLYEAPTKERNGVKVIVPVKYSYDKHTFIRKIREQLAYFENVYFDVLDGTEIDNSFTIVRHEYFQFSPLAMNDKLHLCLDNVYYPLDFEKLGIESIYCPVALRFSLTDGLFPTPNRESIRYTREAIEVIKKRLAQAADHFIEKYNESVTETDNAVEFIKYLSNDSKSLNMYGRGFTINPFEKYATKKTKAPTLKGITHLRTERLTRIRDFILDEYEIKFSLYNRKMHQSTRWGRITASNIHYKTYVYSDKLSGVMKDYLRHVSASSSRHEFVVKKTKPFKLGKLTSQDGNYDTYINLLALKGYPKNEWRTLIKEFQLLSSMLSKDFVNLDTLEIPQSFIDSRKKVRVSVTSTSGPKERRKKLEGEVSVKEAQALERFTGDNCKFVPTTIQMKEAHRIKSLVVYGGTEFTELVNTWYKPFLRKVKFLICSKRELDRLKDIELHNWIKMEKFMEGEHIVFKRAATAFLIGKLYAEYRSVFERINKMECISKDIANKLTLLEEYKEKHLMYAADDLNEAIIEIATKKNLFDMSVYSTYLEIKSLFEKLPFIKAMFSSIPSYNPDPVINATRDLFKYYRQRIDWQHYKLKLNDDMVETPMCDELLNEIL
jgi:hypothetical protein